MAFRRAALPLLLYIALDFANPMMPGAVQLVDGVLKAVAGCMSRGAEDPAPADTTIPRHVATILPRQSPIPVIRRGAAVNPPPPVLVAATLRTRSSPASTLDDD